MNLTDLEVEFDSAIANDNPKKAKALLKIFAKKVKEHKENVERQNRRKNV